MKIYLLILSYCREPICIIQRGTLVARARAKRVIKDERKKIVKTARRERADKSWCRLDGQRASPDCCCCCCCCWVSIVVSDDVTDPLSRRQSPALDCIALPTVSQPVDRRLAVFQRLINTLTLRQQWLSRFHQVRVHAIHGFLGQLKMNVHNANINEMSAHWYVIMYTAIA